MSQSVRTQAKMETDLPFPAKKFAWPINMKRYLTLIVIREIKLKQ